LLQEAATTVEVVSFMIDLIEGPVAETPVRAVAWPLADLDTMRLPDVLQAGPAGQVLAKRPIGVFIGSLPSGIMRGGELNLDAHRASA